MQGAVSRFKKIFQNPSNIDLYRISCGYILSPSYLLLMSPSLSPILHYIQLTITAQSGDTPFIAGLAQARKNLASKISDECINEVFDLVIASKNQTAVLKRSLGN